jgi:hypothetical protein
VVEMLGLPHDKLPVSGSIWDMYDRVFHFQADGFPISKHLTYCIAQRYPGIPIVNGFLGDSIMRGSGDRILGKYETEWDDLAEVLEQRYSRISFKVFRKDILKRIRMRSRIPIEEAIREGSQIGKVFGWTDFYYIERYYISNNFLQHIELTEALLPFYSWALLSYKMEHDYRLFNRDIYYRIFQRYFPTLAKTPHASDHMRPLKVARCTKRWALQLLPIICNKNRLSLLSKGLCIPLTIAGIGGFRQAEHPILNFKRLYLLEQRLRDAGLDFDWECV